MPRRLIAIGALVTSLIVASCRGHPPPEDTDAELFRTPESLTGARELNIAKWTADFLRANGHLPASTQELALPEPPADPKENPLNDGWGLPITLLPVGRGFELRSSGADHVSGTADDIVHRVDDPATVK